MPDAGRGARPTIEMKAFDRSSAFRAARVLVAFCAFAAAFSASVNKSVTVDEFAVCSNGFTLLRTGAFHIDNRVAPLPKILNALPLLFVDARFDPARVPDYTTSWQTGAQFMAENRASYHSLHVLCRLVPCALLAVVCLLTGWFAARLYGQVAGLVATLFCALCPNLLAHGALVTTDIHTAAAVVFALVCLDIFLRNRNGRTGLLLGLALGLACITKFTGALLLLTVPAAVLALQWRRRRGDPAPDSAAGARTWLYMLIAALCALAAINAGFAFTGTLTCVGDYKFETEPFRRLQAWLPFWLTLPLPCDFLSGMDSQLAEKGYTAYLAGEVSTGGFWNYYLVALLVKTPLPVIFLCVLALVLAPLPSRRELPFVLTGSVLLVFFSAATHKNIGVRYVLFLYPLMAVWIARIVPLAAARPARLRKAAWLLLGVCLALNGLETALVWPHFIPYFNQVAGGSRGGHRYLLDSNLDWGQDLPALAEYMKRNGIGKVDLAYFGRVDPAVYGVAYDHLFLGRSNRCAAVSANLLWGRMYFINATSFWPEDKDIFRPLRNLKPSAVLGHTIYVFDLGPPPERASQPRQGPAPSPRDSFTASDRLPAT